MKETTPQPVTKSTGASVETLRALYAAQWKDLHHSRVQDWRLCNLLIVGFIGVGGLKVIGQFPELQMIASIVFAVVSLLAVGITIRHGFLFKEKMGAILEIEKLLAAPVLFKPQKGWHRFFKVQYLIITIYMLFALFFVYLACGGLS
ncbi:hypothetical protein KJ564_12960 [bacterium]|nr:hypothetical protein [bacterium]